MSNVNIRIQEAVDLFNSKYSSVLDLGCRDKGLKKVINKDSRYQGVDFEDADEVKGHNLENGIPFEDSSYDIVFALDVVEHVEAIHHLIDEIIRVAEKEAIIAIPNMYYWRYRLRYLLGLELNGKYKVPDEKVLDRHRWLTDYTQSLKLVQKRIAKSGKPITLNVKYGTTSKIPFIAIFDKLIQKFSPNFATSTVYYQINIDSQK